MLSANWRDKTWILAANFGWRRSIQFIFDLTLNETFMVLMLPKRIPSSSSTVFYNVKRYFEMLGFLAKTCLCYLKYHRYLSLWIRFYIFTFCSPLLPYSLMLLKIMKWYKYIWRIKTYKQITIYSMFPSEFSRYL